MDISILKPWTEITLKRSNVPAVVLEAILGHNSSIIYNVWFYEGGKYATIRFYDFEFEISDSAEKIQIWYLLTNQ